MTTIDSIGPGSSSATSRAGQFSAAVLVAVIAVLRVIADEIVYMVREDASHGRIERGSDDKY